MDHKELFKNSIETQKQALLNAFEFNNLCWDQAERMNNYWMGIVKLSPEIRDLVEQWRTVARKGQKDFKEVMDNSFNNWEAHLEHYGENELKPKTKAKTKQAA